MGDDPKGTFDTGHETEPISGDTGELDATEDPTAAEGEDLSFTDKRKKPGSLPGL